MLKVKTICGRLIGFVLCHLQPVNGMQYGRVTAKELVEAVHEMLSAAGINMELENQSLLQRTITLQEELKDSQAAFILEQVRLQSKSSILNTHIVIIMMIYSKNMSRL